MNIEDFLDLQDSAVQQALAIVRAYCGWHVTPVIQEDMAIDVLHPTNYLILKTGRIVGVHSIEYRSGCDWRSVPLCDVSHSGATWSTAGIIEWRENCHGGFPTGLGSVVVSLTHGFSVEDVMDFIGVVQAVAERYRDTCGVGVKSQSVNGASVTYFGTDDGAGRSGLLEKEKEILSRFKLEMGVCG